jgi:peptide subunit release factor 1 (eRF1)
MHATTDNEKTGQQTDAGLITLDSGRATLGRLVDGQPVVVETFSRSVEPAPPGEERSSAERAARTAFFEDAAASAMAAFASGTEPLFVGGPLTATERFVEEHLDTTLRDRLCDTYTVEYTDERGLALLAGEAATELPEAATPAWRNVLRAFFDRLGTDRVAYGREATAAAAEAGRAETLLVASTETAEHEELRTQADAAGVESHVVPAATAKGKQFATVFGVGVLLTPEEGN